MSRDEAAAFFLFSLIAAVTPGPSNVLLAAAGANLGIRRGLRCVLGVAAGMGAMMLLMASGVAGILLAHEAVLPAVKLCGTAFLLWLAWRIATAGRGGAGLAPGGFRFLDAAALQWVNPKAWVVAAGAAATYLDPAPRSLPLAALSFAAVFVAAALPSGLLWLAFGASVQRLLDDERRRRAFNVAMGLLLAASVVMILA
jgi:threonine/homoserine/homoserine lactone efflux protein